MNEQEFAAWLDSLRIRKITIGSEDRLALVIAQGRLDWRGCWHPWQPCVFWLWRGCRYPRHQ